MRPHAQGLLDSSNDVATEEIEYMVGLFKEEEGAALVQASRRRDR